MVVDSEWYTTNHVGCYRFDSCTDRNGDYYVCTAQWLGHILNSNESQKNANQTVKLDWHIDALTINAIIINAYLRCCYCLLS